MFVSCLLIVLASCSFNEKEKTLRMINEFEIVEVNKENTSLIKYETNCGFDGACIHVLKEELNSDSISFDSIDTGQKIEGGYIQKYLLDGSCNYSDVLIDVNNKLNTSLDINNFNKCLKIVKESHTLLISENSIENMRVYYLLENSVY